MEKQNIFLLEMANAGATSGVNRYLNVLTEGLRKIGTINLYHICLIEGGSLVFPRREAAEDGFVRIQLPLPKRMHEILTKEYWIEKYNEQVFRLIKEELQDKPNCILHLHTLNLIDLAIYIKKRIPCKIITHMHCIPWKALYNHDQRKFNELYSIMYKQKSITKPKPKDFIRLLSEWDAYHKADHIVCVTNCAKAFLRKVMMKEGGISVIPNGIDDDAADLTIERTDIKNGNISLLYVGVITASKGLRYILEAMGKVKAKGYKLSITAAGIVAPEVRKKLENEYPNININFTGLLPYADLCRLYESCDIGIIASLQEQSSYVAIEMMMHSLPIITTAVDGLNEMFENEKSALKVSTRFSPVLGLSVDTEEMARQIIRLIESSELRVKLSEGSRKRYKEKFTLEKMLTDTIRIYNQCSNSKKKQTIQNKKK